MRSHLITLLFVCLIAERAGEAAPQANTGSIRGHIRLSGKPPGNPIIRMGVDPMCSRINAGKRVVQEFVVSNIAGDLANVFVKLQGSFPQAPMPTQPVTIDQRGCIYFPRVVGARVGQTLQVRNSDTFLHNVHSLSGKTNSFNVGQPMSGAVYSFKLKDEETMLRLKCDIHTWMTAYIGVVTHPYFAVSDVAGTFVIEKVPPGTHTIQAWHERFGILTQTVRVRPGATTSVEFTYSGTEKP